MINEHSDEKILSPLDFEAINSLDDTSQDENRKSGEVESIHLVTDGNFSPGFDVMIRFKSLDSHFNNFRLSFRIRKETDAPRIVQPGSMLIGYSTQRDEIQEVNHILLSFSRPESLSGFLTDLSSHIASLSEMLNE